MTFVAPDIPVNVLSVELMALCERFHILHVPQYAINEQKTKNTQNASWKTIHHAI